MNVQRERDPWKQIKPWERTSYAVTRRAEHRRRPPRGPIPRREEGEGRCINSNVTTLPVIGGEKQKYITEKKSERPREEEEREGEAQSANGALRPRLLASARPPAPAPFLSGRGVGGAEIWYQLWPDRQQPAGPDAGGRPPPVAEREQGEALRRGPQGADGIRQHRRRVHHRHREREPAVHGRQPRRRQAVGDAARAALPTGHANHLHHRRQRGVLRQRHRHDGQPPARHEGDLRRGRRTRPRRPGDRVVGALGERARHQLPAVVRRVPGGPRAVHPAAARLPRADELAVPDQRVPVLRVQGEPRERVAAVRAVRAQPRRARPKHQPLLRQHAVRADRRRVRGHEGHGAHGHRREDLRDRVAVQGGRGRGRRHRGERRGVQRQPDAADRHEPGDTAQAQRAHRRVRVRAVQRGHETRADLGA
uniref:Uncharacterized protein n=1 Tax=Oryza rufipogon TaxID=4529 RepID=A0A0E0N5C6_ORYRU